MQSMTVEPHCYVIPYILLCLVAAFMITPVNPFLFQTTEEAFSYGIIPATAFLLMLPTKPCDLSERRYWWLAY